MKTCRVNRKWWVPLENKTEMMGAADRVADGMEQSWITAHVFQLTCLLTDVSCPTCGETGLYISVCEGSDQRAGFASKLALTYDLCKYKKFEMSPRTQFSDKKNVAYEVNPRMVVFSHESSIGDNQVIMVLGIQAHGDDDFVPSFSVKLLFVAYFQLKIPKALVVIKIQL